MFFLTLLHIQPSLQQFADDFDHELDYFSGVYSLVIMSGNFYYVEERAQKAQWRYQHQQARFVKCEHSWMFSFDEGPCEETWRMKSPEVTNFDIRSVIASTWTFKDRSGLEVPLPLFSLKSNDCNTDNNMCSHHGKCDEISRTCVCEAGWSGLSCEFEVPCPIISVDTSKQVIPKPDILLDFGQHYATSGFKQVMLESDDDAGPRKFLQVYEKPVYIRGPPILLAGDIGLEDIFIILFTGRRWIITTFEKISGINRLYNDSLIGSGHMPYFLKEVATFMMTEFHAYHSDYEALFMSDPVDANTPTNSATCIGLMWSQVVYDSHDMLTFMEKTNSGFVCVLCNETKAPCQNSGLCRSMRAFEGMSYMDLQDIPKNFSLLEKRVRSFNYWEFLLQPKEWEGSQPLSDLFNASMTTDSWGYCECGNMSKGYFCEILNENNATGLL